MLPQGRRVVLGRAVGAHGLRGEVRIRYFGDGPDNLMRASEIWLGQDEQDLEARGFSIEGVGTGRAGEVRISLEGIKDRDAATALRGLLVLGDSDWPRGNSTGISWSVAGWKPGRGGSSESFRRSGRPARMMSWSWRVRKAGGT